MKKLILSLVMFNFFMLIYGCQKEPSNENTAQIQESVDRIKARIQDNLDTPNADVAPANDDERQNTQP